MWDERFRRLCLWRSQHGHCAVPIAQGDLGIWVSKQRQLNKKGKLSQDKIDRLNSLAFTWSTTDADWDDKFKRLNEWRCRNGHCSVPFNEGELGWWVNTQRQCKRKGKLSGSRQKQLDSIGFVWNPSLCSQQLQQQQQQQEQHEQEIGRWEINREKVLQVKEEQEVVLSSGDGGDSARGEGCDVAVKVLCGSGIVANDGKKMMMIMEGTKKSEAVIATTKGKRTDGSGEKHGENPGEEDEDLDEEGDSVNTDNTDNTDDSDDSKDYSVSDNEENSGDDDDDGDDYEDGDNDNHDDDDYNNDDNNEEEKDENVGFKAAAGEEPEEEDNGNDNDNGIGNGNAKGNSDSNGDGEGNANDVKKLKGNESVLAHHHQNENNTKNQQQIHTTEKHEQNPTNINYCKQVIEANNNVPQADNLNPATIHYHQKHDIHHHHHHNHDHHDVNNHTNDDYDNINWGLSLEQQFLPWQVSSRATAGASGSSMPVLLGRDDIDPNASWVYMSRNDNNNCTSISSSERERDVRDDVQIWGSSSSVSDMWSALHASVAVARDNVGVVGNMNAGCGNGNGNGNGNGGCNDEMEDIDDDDRYAAEETWIAEMMEVARREGPF